jgi:hypothetical protein
MPRVALYPSRYVRFADFEKSPVVEFARIAVNRPCVKFAGA